MLGGFLMGTVTTLAAEIQQDGKVLASWTKEDVNALMPSALIALRRITGEVESALAQLTCNGADDERRQSEVQQDRDPHQPQP
ncbi:hypothetical protein ACIBJF_50810 [Streptomyces sp. NPDC050743]|uniref:hypothetical protein n=1 Tax=Streptomyces sp. NPDC050743 TaxID=3365634 RepID=UPI003794B890